MQSTGNLLNLILPLLLIAAIALTIYAIILFIRSITKKSPALRAKSIKIALIPILYIIGMFFYFLHINEHDRQMRREIPGTYIYNFNDSLQFSAVLNPTSTFTFKMGADTMTGHWKLISNSETIRFFNHAGSEFSHSTLATDSGRICLPFFFNGRQIRFYKK